MRILLMGPQGSGKGTIGEKLSEALELPLVGVGDILRSVPPDHEYFTLLNEAMAAGDLAPNHIVASLISERVSADDCKTGYILDGWARQESDLDQFDPSPDVVLNIVISEETSVKRISGRRTCSSNGKIYNIYTLPKEMLSECTGELVQREDDTEEAVRRRLAIYYSETQKVIDRFKEQGILKVVDGEGTPDEVFAAALEALGLKNR